MSYDINEKPMSHYAMQPQKPCPHDGGQVFTVQGGWRCKDCGKVLEKK